MASPITPTAAPEALSGSPPVSAEGLRVALYSGNYNSVRDGANKALNRLVGRLLERGAAVRVYSPVAPEPAFEPTGDLVAVPSVPIPMRNEYRISYGLSGPVRQDLIDFRPNLLHLAVPDYTAWRAQTLARTLGIPIVASLHTRFETYFEYYGLGFLRPLGERYLEMFYGRCDLVLTPNAALGYNVCRASGTRTSMWSRGVDGELFSPANRDLEWRRANGYADNEVVVAFFGRLVLEKGTEIFGRIVTELRRRGHRVVPLLIGDGPERERMAAALGEAVFTGHVEAAELARAIACADVVINPSVTEAFGNVNLEAMSAGLAVVGSDVPVTRAMIEPGVTGLVADPASATDFADAAESLIVDPELRARIGAAARREAARYDWDAILDGVIADYRALVAGQEVGNAC
ncbi:MAG: glycosyl transferase family 1 [Sphingomonadales bacterium 32-68-7]|nr:MAG: glycosyl transferase family 1 [Sphingomonadales bacterium 12-68-11]OYX10595.1 MAG: glycosyl transferase family 1 [Sphingomonadales bacterium 32-68-7]